jgi:hypothetical protein
MHLDPAQKNRVRENKVKGLHWKFPPDQPLKIRGWSLLSRSALAIIFALFLCMLAISTLPAPVQAAPPRQTGSNTGLTISGAILDVQAVPGQVFTHTIFLNNGAQSGEINVHLDPRGLGQDQDSSFLQLPPMNDASRYSARTWITGIDVQVMHLLPGASGVAHVNISVPINASLDTHYATIWITSEPVGTGSSAVGSLVTYLVPLVIRLQGTSNQDKGKIENLFIHQTAPGQPLLLEVIFKNTGNHHYHAAGKIEIKNTSSQNTASLSLPRSDNSLIPTFLHRYKVSYLPGSDFNLKNAEYLVAITDDSGVVIDQRKFEYKDISTTPTMTVSPVPGKTPTRRPKPTRTSTPTGGIVIPPETTEIVAVVVTTTPPATEQDDATQTATTPHPSEEEHHDTRTAMPEATGANKNQQDGSQSLLCLLIIFLIILAILFIRLGWKRLPWGGR